MKGKLSDQWQTPQKLFEELNKEFNFDIDLCATKENSKCNDFCIDYLKGVIGNKNSNCVGNFREELEKGRISAAFCNPPYSTPRPFIEKAWEDSKHCKVVCLVKCDPSTKWWSTFWNYETITQEQSNVLQRDVWFAGPKPGCEVQFFPKRIKFDPPPSLAGKKLSGPTFSSALIIMDRREV